jgi:hypothetical protein
MKYSSEYQSWHAIKTRCLNKNSKDYARYGAKGIGICDEWRDSFQAFYSHVGPRQPGTTIDRIKNSLGYIPGNVRWATGTEQAMNKTNNTWVTLKNGAIAHINEVAAILGITRGAAYQRMKRGKLSV